MAKTVKCRVFKYGWSWVWVCDGCMLLVGRADLTERRAFAEAFAHTATCTGKRRDPEEDHD